MSIFEAVSLKEATYKCTKGHVIKVFGNWTTLSVVSGGATWSYNYCPMCWGEWAESQWPLTKEDDR